MGHFNFILFIIININYVSFIIKFNHINIINLNNHHYNINYFFFISFFKNILIIFIFFTIKKLIINI